MSQLTLPSPLITTDWLQANIHHQQLVVLDASAHMPGSERNAYNEWQEQRIPNALFFDLNHKIADLNSQLPHMLPSAEVFTQEVQALGINQDSIIVVYDSLGIFSAPRAWWMFAAMGHMQCAVLDGGLPEWLAQNGNIESGGIHTTTTKGNFVAHQQDDWIKCRQDMLDAIDNNSIAILDARSEARFLGQAKEPREGLISGHIPSSKNLPFTDLLNNGKFKSPDELKVHLEKKLSHQHTLYATCGSGITACIIAFAAHLVGYNKLAVYDGSWSEWGEPSLQLPIDKSE